MAIVYDGPVLPDDLTMFVRNVPQDQNLILDRLLPNRMIRSNRIDFGTMTRNGRVAKFRTFDGPLHVARRDTAQIQNVGLPPLSDTLAVGEYERLQLEFARTGGTNTGALVDAIYDDATILTQNILRRMELARGDVLTDGKFTLAGEGGLYMEADYGVPAGNIVTAGTLWSNIAASIIGNLNTWVDYYIGLNGFAPGGMVMSRTTLGYFLTNTEMRTATGSMLGNNLLLTRPQVDQYLDSRGLPPILFTYDSQVVDPDTSSSVRVLPQNRVLFVPPDGTELGYTAWGVTATSLELVGSNRSEVSFEQAPGVVGILEKSGPPYRQYTFVDAVGMPVVTNPNALMVATVA